MNICYLKENINLASTRNFLMLGNLGKNENSIIIAYFYTYFLNIIRRKKLVQYVFHNFSIYMSSNSHHSLDSIVNSVMAGKSLRTKGQSSYKKSHFRNANYFLLLISCNLKEKPADFLLWLSHLPLYCHTCKMSAAFQTKIASYKGLWRTSLPDFRTWVNPFTFS